MEERPDSSAIMSLRHSPRMVMSTDSTSLSVGYDFKSSKGSTEIEIEPVFGRGRFS